MLKLLLPKDLATRCISISRASLPYEACGLIGGVEQNNGNARSKDTIWEARSIHPVRNAHRSPTSFALDGAEMIEAEERIDDAGDTVIGVWHSHPTSAAVPSETDLSDASVYDPFGVFVHVIVSMQGFAPTVAAFSYQVQEEDPLRKYWLVRCGS